MAALFHRDGIIRDTGILSEFWQVRLGYRQISCFYQNYSE